MSMLDPLPATEPPMRPIWIWAVMGLWLAANVLLFFLSLVFGPALITLGLVGLVAILPFPFVTTVQLGESSSTARLLSVLAWLMTMGVVIGMTVMLVMGAYLSDGVMAPGGGQKTLLAFGLSALAAGLGLFTYLPAGRRLAARWLPIDEQSFTAATGLAMAIPLTICALIPLTLTGKAAISLSGVADNNEIASAGMTLAALGAQLVWLVLFAIVAGGFPIRRTFGETMARLGVGRVSLPTIGVALAIAVVMVAILIPAEHAVNQLWEHMGWPRTDVKTFDQMLGGVKSWYGAIVVGVVAGVSEELLVRGLLQPRLGMTLSNLLFAAGHAYQYCWDGLLLVFGIGLICGLVKKRYNTTTSMIVHGAYDTILILLATYAQDWLP